MAETTAFPGFSRDAIQFLADLAQHNERTWFQPRKAEYERLLKEPLEALCLALGERFEAQSLPLRADPSKSPFRIYRDVRFSNDKTPYKTHISASFPWAGKGRADPSQRRNTNGVSRSVAIRAAGLSQDRTFRGRWFNSV